MAPFILPTFPCPTSNPRAAQRAGRVRSDPCAGAGSILPTSLRLEESGAAREHPTPPLPSPWPSQRSEQAQPEEPSPGRGIGGCGHGLRCGHSMGASVPPPARPSRPSGAATMGRPPLLRPAPKHRTAPSPALGPARSLARRAAADSIASFMSFSLSSRHSPPPLLFFFSLA